MYRFFLYFQGVIRSRKVLFKGVSFNPPVVSWSFAKSHFFFPLKNVLNPIGWSLGFVAVFIQTM